MQLVGETLFTMLLFLAHLLFMLTRLQIHRYSQWSDTMVSVGNCVCVCVLQMEILRTTPSGDNLGRVDMTVDD